MLEWTLLVVQGNLTVRGVGQLVENLEFFVANHPDGIQLKTLQVALLDFHL